MSFIYFIFYVVENGVDEEVFRNLNDDMIERLIPELGFNYKFKQRFRSSFIEVPVINVLSRTLNVNDHLNDKTDNTINNDNEIDEENKIELDTECNNDASYEEEINASQIEVSSKVFRHLLKK